MFQMFMTSIVAALGKAYVGEKTVCTLTEAMQMGGFNFGTMLLSNQALTMVSYPLQALTKSCKILSVLIVGLVFGGLKFTKQ